MADNFQEQKRLANILCDRALKALRENGQKEAAAALTAWPEAWSPLLMSSFADAYAHPECVTEAFIESFRPKT
jgi:hypothetical protein